MLISLEHQSGLPMAFDPLTNTLRFAEGIVAEAITPRTSDDMRPFLAEPDASGPETAYTVYRGVSRIEDAESIKKANLRYDITIIPQGHFVSTRKEFLKTAGHYHPLKPGTTLEYPEVFEVISGRAYWLMQRPATVDDEVVEEIFAIEAGPGEKAVILPGFGLISINAYEEPLVIANWISCTVHNDYLPFERLRGGGYWMTEGPTTGTIEFERNSNYREVGELKKLRPKEVPEFGLLRSKPIYSLVNDLEKLRFLNAPEEFRDILTIERCYRQL